MITFEPLGGLGNQLFTYAVGLANASRLRTGLRADLKNFRDDKLRSYELGSFENSVEIEIDSSEVTRTKYPAGLAGARCKLVGREKRRASEQILREHDNHFSQNFLEAEDGSRLRGYFQSWKYLEPVSDLVTSQLWAVKNPSLWFRETSAELSDAGQWIGVHVRLGDYQQIPNMGVIADEYYRRAIRLLRKMGNEGRVLVFTDSPELVRGRKIFGDATDFRVLDSANSGSPLETMLAMSQASHLVMANSTFSWWSAWLGRARAERTVIFPRPWINRKTWDDRDMHRPEWVGISRESIGS